MRRFSTAASTAAATSVESAKGKWAFVPKMFQQVPIGELVEMKTIASVQRLVEQIPSDPVPKRLTPSGSSDQGYAQWLQQYQASKQWESSSHLDKQEFEALVQDSVTYLKTIEDAAWQEKPKIGVIEESDIATQASSEYIEAFKVKLAKHKCANATKYFEQLDKDKDGKVSVKDVDKLLRVLTNGSTADWLQSQFQLFDTDSDNIVNETESRLILESMVETQKIVLAEIFALHVDNLPKKHPKLLTKSMKEEDWKSKIPEKIRCVFHFAEKEDAENKLLAWDYFKESQGAELPELDNILGVYAKGFYDDRFMFYERKRDRRDTRIKGLLLAAAIGVGDYIAAII
uniref:EF-hand domain-containing protein n=1 Tax=Globisporangium ultimum (strain ATCC 200006 / CBS 805.95 / DAOM BR144) TaxID=431595 RepID=K3WYC7_GLOUD